jgi:hypothetical protein
LTKDFAVPAERVKTVEQFFAHCPSNQTNSNLTVIETQQVCGGDPHRRIDAAGAPALS